jgi:catechol 2,3-dioxygenase-like lactoylglutathione lyase family enzyme
MHKPNPTKGLHHVALYIKNFEACEFFYTQLLGMQIDWKPDSDNLYLTSGNDNFALHRAAEDFIPSHHQRLDHIGFFLQQRDDVDTWYEYLKEQGVTMRAKPKDHRDGTRSFYLVDPDGNTVQMIYIPSKDKNK